METNTQLSKVDSNLQTKPFEYKQLVGRLIYLTVTWIDLCLLLTNLANLCHRHKQSILKLSEKCYSMSRGQLAKASSFHLPHKFIPKLLQIWYGLHALIQGSQQVDRIFLRTSLIFQKSQKLQKQATISRSTMEDKYRVMIHVTYELTCILRLLKGIGVEHSNATFLQCGSEATQYITANSIFYKRMKYIEIDYHFVKEKLREGVISFRSGNLC